MNLRVKFLLFLVILIPLAIGLIGQPLAMAQHQSEAFRSLNDARKKGDLAAESAGLVSILDHLPWRGDLWQRLGQLHLDSGPAQGAADALEKAASLKQLDDQGVIWLADALISTGRNDEARILLGQLESVDLSILIQAAALLRQNHLLDSSVDMLLKALAIAPADEAISYQLGVLNMAAQPADALDHLGGVKEDKQLSLKAVYLSEVITAYQASEINEGWYIAAGQALSRVGEWDAATASFELAAEDEPDNAIAWALLAEARQQTGEEGKSSLERALALDPAGEMVNGLAGLYYRREGKTDLALTYLQKALTANPGAVVWQIEIGGALADAGRLDDALEAYNAAITMDRGNTQGWEVLAKFSLPRNYRVEEVGLPAARQLVLLEPRNPVYLDLLGTAYMTLADLDSAERFFLQALTYDPEEAAILIHLGQTSMYRGDKQSAFAYLRRASASASDDRLRAMADRLLAEYGADEH